MEKKAIDIFEAGKDKYHCSKCDTDYMLTPKQPKKCICGATLEPVLQIQINTSKVQVHVIVGVYGGVIEDIEVFTDDKKATEYEKKLCEEYGVPFKQEERDQYYDSDGEHEVKHFITTVRE